MNQELTDFISNLLHPLQYDVVSVEVQKKQKKLRIFIDRIKAKEPSNPIGIEDCVKVSKALDEPLDQFKLLENVFDGTFELEVSSPGIDRPLVKLEDFENFATSCVRIHTFRPLTSAEALNDSYVSKNPKQKNFVGTLKGVHREDGRSSILLVLPQNEIIQIPYELISKANLEPAWEELSTQLRASKTERKKGPQP